MARDQKKGIAEGRTSLFVDQSGFYLLPGVVRTDTPQGQTPILGEFLTRDHLAVMSGITPAGKLSLLVQARPFKAEDVVRFLRHLLRQIPGKLSIIWDGSPIHRSKVVKAFLARGAAARIHLEQLPGYAPELNPDEGIWNYLKRVELRNLVCQDLAHVRHELRKATARLRHKPHIIQGCVRQPGYH